MPLIPAPHGPWTEKSYNGRKWADQIPARRDGSEKRRPIPETLSAMEH